MRPFTDFIIIFIYLYDIVITSICALLFFIAFFFHLGLGDFLGYFR